eukprot:gene3864-4220_t
MASRYVKGNLLGEGTWGHVYQASRRSDGLVVAVKRIKPMDARFGINFTALREIKFLKEVKQENIVDLKDVFISGGVLHMVMEFCPFDLLQVIQDKTIYLRSNHSKCYLKMILLGIEHLHKNYILHRDLKPANLLIGNDGQLKLADFGLARNFGSPEAMTSEVVTRWYRAPELLFGAQYYSVGVDIWAVGCIFAEIVLRSPLFPGDTDIEQLAKIFNVLGTPSPTTWLGVDMLPKYIEFEVRQPLNLGTLFGKNKQLIDLLLRLLELNPSKRITATEALQHPYFSEAPEACSPGDLPVPAAVKARLASTNNPLKRESAGDLIQDSKRVRLSA